MISIFPEKERDFKLTPDEIILLRAIAKNRMRVKTAARDIPASGMYIRYNVTKIRAKTGLDPRDFYDLVKLLKIAEEDEHEADS